MQRVYHDEEIMMQSNILPPPSSARDASWFLTPLFLDSGWEFVIKS